MKILLTLLLFVSLVAVAVAEDDISVSTGIVGNGRYLGARALMDNLQYQYWELMHQGILKLMPNRGLAQCLLPLNPIAAAAAASGIKLQVAGTGYNFAAPYVPTMAATPAAGQ